MPGSRTVAIALTAAVLAVSGCASDMGANGAGEMKAHTNATSLGQPDRPIAGPQGATPQFLV